MKIKEVFLFFEDVKREFKKIKWIKRNEVLFSTLMVFIIMLLCAILFFFVDSFLYYLVERLVVFASEGY